MKRFFAFFDDPWQALACVFVGIILSTLGFLVVDCSGGHTQVAQAYVYDREYREAYVTVHTRIETVRNRDGQVVSSYPVIEQDYHPAEYSLWIEDIDGHRELSVSEAQYRATVIGSRVKIKKYYGRWTGAKHFETLL